MKYLLIMNPGSRGGKSSRKISKILKYFKDRHIDHTAKYTQSLQDAYIFSVEGNHREYDVIVAIGGDGTINRVLNGFFDDEGRRISKSKFGVIYTGTSPDFCKSYHIPLKLEDALETLIRGNSIKVHIGMVTLSKKGDLPIHTSIEDRKRDREKHFFACCANVGLGPLLAKYANSGIRKYVGDFLGTFLSLIKILSFYRGEEFEIIIDDEKKSLTKVFNLSIGKTYYIASGIKVNHTLKVKDEKMYLLTIRNISLKNVVSVLKRIYSGNKIKNDDTIHLTMCKKIEIRCNKKLCEVEFDGDPMGYLPCKIESTKDCLDVIVNE